jgi:hypothetical protein
MLIIWWLFTLADRRSRCQMTVTMPPRSKGHSQMLQGTLVSLSTSSYRSIKLCFFSNLHLFLVRLTGRSRWTSCQGNTHQSFMLIEVRYRAHLQSHCLCFSPVASSTSWICGFCSICDLANYGPLAIWSGVNLPFRLWQCWFCCLAGLWPTAQPYGS